MRWPEPEQHGEPERSRRAGSAEPGLRRTVCSGLRRPGLLGSGDGEPPPPPRRAAESAAARAPSHSRPSGGAPPPATGRRCQPPRAPHLSALPTYLSALPTFLRAPPTYLSAFLTFLSAPPTYLSALPTFLTSARSPPQPASHLSALPPQPARLLSALPTSARSLPQPARARCPGRVNSDPASQQLSVSSRSSRRTHVTPFPKTAAPRPPPCGPRAQGPGQAEGGAGPPPLPEMTSTEVARFRGMSCGLRGPQRLSLT